MKIQITDLTTGRVETKVVESIDLLPFLNQWFRYSEVQLHIADLKAGHTVFAENWLAFRKA